MNIQSTTQPSFGKLYMPEYKTLVRKYGTEIATALEAQRKPSEKAAKQWDVYVCNAWKGKSNLEADFKVYPKNKNNVEKNLDDKKWGCMTPINELAKSIREVIKDKKSSLLADTLVENNLATQYEADSFLYNYSGSVSKLQRLLLMERELGNVREQMQILRDLALIRQTLANHDLTKKGDKDIIFSPNLIMQRMIKKNVPLKPIMEDFQDIGMHMPISSEWYLHR